MKKALKKAFTLVELLVVIAIVAVLTVAGIVGYTAFTKKAQLSNDVGLMTQINVALQGDEALSGKNHTFQQAREDVLDKGIDLAKIKLSSKDLRLAWDSAADRVVLIEGETVIAPQDYQGKSELTDMFVVATDAAEVNAGTTYNFYLPDGFDTTELTTVKVGIDVGTNLDVDIAYQSEAAETRLFNTNGGKLTINAQNATVDHYGTANTVDIKAVAANSYHENGKILGRIFLAKGRVVVNKTESTQEKAPQIVVTAQNATDVKLELNTKASVVVEDQAIEAALKNNISGSAAEEVKENVTKITMISDASTLDNDMQDGYYKLNTSITTNADITWENKNITLDLNGHTVTFATPSSENYATVDSNYLLLNGSNVTILDSAGNGGMQCQLLVGKPLLRITNNAALTIDSGNFTANSYAQASTPNRSNQNLIDLFDGKLVVNGGTLNNTGNTPTISVSGLNWLPAYSGYSGRCINMYLNEMSNFAYELEINGGTFSAGNQVVIFGSRSSTGSVTINSGHFSAGSAICLYLPHQGLTTINGGIFEGGTCVVVKSGDLEIKGGTFTASGNKPSQMNPSFYTGSILQSTGDAIVIVSSSNDQFHSKPLVYNISGATITSKNGQAIHVYVATDTQAPTVNYDSSSEYSYEVTHQS